MPTTPKEQGEAKPITLHSRTDTNVRIDPTTRTAAFTCVHPNGLLGAYETLIPWHQLKRVVGAILQAEGGAEFQQQKPQPKPTLVGN